MAKTCSGQRSERRRGAVLILIAGMVVGLVVLTAVVIDVGYLAMSKTQLQAADDSAALAGGMELYKGLGSAPILTPTQTQTAARAIAVDYASRNPGADQASVYVDSARDIRFGNARFVGGSWQKSWGVSPINMIGVDVLRNQADSGAGDGPVPLFFSGFVGANANLAVTATAALMPGHTFYIPPGSNLTTGNLPFAIDEATWNQLMSGTGPDAYNVNTTTNAVSSGSDGVKEADLYPNSGLPSSGNRGTIDLGNPNNSTTDLKRQITNGLNASDLAYFANGELSASPSDPLAVNGETGISSGFKTQLESIIGQPRTVAVFTTVSGPGNNATFTIIKFVGIRIVDVKLTGNPKHVWVQPATVVDPTLVGDIEGEITNDSIFAPIMLIE